MARTNEWLKYQMLVSKIEDAISDAMTDGEYGDCDAPYDYIYLP